MIAECASSSESLRGDDEDGGEKHQVLETNWAEMILVLQAKASF